MDFDVQELSAEIRQIDYEYRQTSDHFVEVFGRGRGRGRGRFRGRGRGRQSVRYLPPGESGRWNSEGIYEPRVASSISGANQEAIQSDFIPPVILKRPASQPMDHDPKIRNRNRRMFSSLLSTLEKFREENDNVEKSEKWRKREEISKRAMQKTNEESIRLKEKQKKDWEEQKRQEKEKLDALDLMRKVKGLQLIYAKRRQQRELLLRYLSTETVPVVYWLPVKHDKTTQAMIDAQTTEHLAWMAEQQESFEREKERIESGLPLEEEQEETPVVKSTIHLATENTSELEAGEFQPVSELQDNVPEEIVEHPIAESPAPKRPRIDPEVPKQDS